MMISPAPSPRWRNMKSGESRSSIMVAAWLGSFHRPPEWNGHRDEISTSGRKKSIARVGLVLCSFSQPKEEGFNPVYMDRIAIRNPQLDQLIQCVKEVAFGARAPDWSK